MTMVLLLGGGTGQGVSQREAGFGILSPESPLGEISESTDDQHGRLSLCPPSPGPSFSRTLRNVPTVLRTWSGAEVSFPYPVTHTHSHQSAASWQPALHFTYSNGDRKLDPLPLPLLNTGSLCFSFLIF